MKLRIPNNYRVEFHQIAVRNDDGNLEKLAAPWFIAAFRIEANSEEGALYMVTNMYFREFDEELHEARVVEVDY